MQYIHNKGGDQGSSGRPSEKQFLKNITTPTQGSQTTQRKKRVGPEPDRQQNRTVAARTNALDDKLEPNAETWLKKGVSPKDLPPGQMDPRTQDNFYPRKYQVKMFKFDPFERGLNRWTKAVDPEIDDIHMKLNFVDFLETQMHKIRTILDFPEEQGNQTTSSEKQKQQKPY